MNCKCKKATFFCEWLKAKQTLHSIFSFCIETNMGNFRVYTRKHTWSRIVQFNALCLQEYFEYTNSTKCRLFCLRFLISRFEYLHTMNNVFVPWPITNCSSYLYFKRFCTILKIPVVLSISKMFVDNRFECNFLFCCAKLDGLGE